MAISIMSMTVFSFQGSSPDFIINYFDIMGEKGEDMYLMENHRSTPEIIEFANKINSINTIKVAKDLIATRPHGKQVSCRGFWSKEEEYKYIVDFVKKYLHIRKIPVIILTVI